MQCEGLPPENYGLYLLGSLEGPELAELTLHLDRECAQCRLELSSASRVWYGVGLAAPKVEPRGFLRKRVISLVRDSEPFRIAWWQPVAALAGLALAVFGGFQLAGTYPVPAPVVSILPAPGITVLERENQELRAALAASKASAVSAPVRVVTPVFTPAVRDNNATLLAELTREREQVASVRQELLRQKQLTEEATQRFTALASQPKPDNSEVQRQLASAQIRTEQLNRDLSQYKALLAAARQRIENAGQSAALLANPNLKVVQLRGTAKDSAVQGHVLLAAGFQAVFYGAQMPTLPAGRTYQLWLIRSSAPAIVSAGVFQPDNRQLANVQFSSATLTSYVTAIAVTDEPEGGSSSPTGHKLLIGS